MTESSRPTPPPEMDAAAIVERMAAAMDDASGYPPGTKNSPNRAYWRMLARAALNASGLVEENARLRGELAKATALIQNNAGSILSGLKHDLAALDPEETP